MMFGFIKKIFVPKIVPEPTPKIPNPRIEAEPRWMWDIYNTGFRRPEEPKWYQAWQREVCLRREQVEKVALIAERFDELKKYLEDLDKHMGRTIERPKIMTMWTWWGEVDMIRTEEP